METNIVDQEENKYQADRLKRKKERNKSNLQVGPGVVLVFLWLGLACAGYWYQDKSIKEAINTIQADNTKNVQELENKIESLETEVQEIQSALANTDTKLTSTSSVSDEVNKRITELDGQLKALEKSLKILQETGNEDY
ncbi:hypothetical protein SAMN05660649_01660 [Desulfotomaculum arcticum]|uniref:Uncharacterized protein n=1 Tax=Desulfotruncus arcticus DSM 17038 TaxID=1121424 RepID=A0A1I2RWU1_9FIRM|nr:hypothetical protein [Desulfotruncus arcticus]SFG45028.1 hypothetical protein SAMN05660649_01660 [Desulfotomaculum arcticum] [Desulfotruncus arcticus DSM 17038]